MRLNKTEVSAEHLKYRRNLKRRKIIIHVLQVVILVGFFGLWELAAQRVFVCFILGRGLAE